MPPLDEIPEYIIDQFDSRYGRAGRGRLWVHTGFEIESIEWDDTKSMAKAASNCGGIVIKAEDVKHIANLPGFVTDLSLNLYQSG